MIAEQQRRITQYTPISARGGAWWSSSPSSCSVSTAPRSTGSCRATCHDCSSRRSPFGITGPTTTTAIRISTRPRTTGTYRGDSYYETNEYGIALLRQALNNGYREGWLAGTADREDGWRPSYGSSYAYRDANYGYNGYYLDRGTYNYYFREGFRRGYDDGYNSSYRYGRYLGRDGLAPGLGPERRASRPAPRLTSGRSARAINCGHDWTAVRRVQADPLAP